jgi:hypothetical protein
MALSITLKFYAADGSIFNQREEIHGNHTHAD